MVESLAIAEVARLTGLTTRALRFYEARGLVKPRRTAAGLRYFGPSELEQLHRIMAMKRAGLTLGQIHKFGSGRTIDLRDVIIAQMESLQERRVEIDQAHNLLSSTLGKTPPPAVCLQYPRRKLAVR